MRNYIVEVKTLDGDQEEFAIKIDNGIITRLGTEGGEYNDIIFIPPATHDLIDIINNSTAGDVVIEIDTYDILQTNVNALGKVPKIVAVYKDNKLPIGEIQLLNQPFIGAAMVHLPLPSQEGNMLVYKNIECLGYINFIDARQ